MVIKFEILMLTNNNINLQQEVSDIMNNLDEAILSKSNLGLRFCNKNGFKILENIENIINY